jgi:tetratricopeptide (TPR) repeat protein
MNHDGPKIQSTVLESAWQRYAEFDANARAAANQRLFSRQATIILALVAVFLAVFTGTFEIYARLPVQVQNLLEITLILILIVDFIILALAIKSQQQQKASVLRATAEEIKKEIYLYRTVLQWHEERDQWLSQRVTDIQRHVADSFGSELTLAPYRGPLPPHHHPEDPASDPGFTRLLPNDYIKYRLENQLAEYVDLTGAPRQIRRYLHVGLLAMGGLSVLLAALEGPYTSWVAATVFVAAALISWLEPRELDSAINIYNQLVLGLNIIRDRWHSFSKEEQTGEEFFKLVLATEKVIWSHYNKSSSEIWRVIDDLNGQKHDALDEVLMLPTIVLSDKEIEAEIVDIEASPVETPIVVEKVTDIEQSSNGITKKQETALTIVETAEMVDPQAKAKKGRPHAFVVMPFGRKQGPDGRWIDFDSIYHDLIRPALETAGFESFRADEESVSGDILTDMFQELLLADLVIADLSIDNANVFYELGVRHSMRKRGMVHIQSGRSYMPFDIFNVRTIPYHCDKNGRPDPEYLEKDRQAITKITRETWASDVDRVHSPIFNLLDGLVEPDHKSLRTPLATGFWREYNEWRERVTIAQRQKRIGDILLLTEEISNPLIKEEAIAEAGRALRGMGRFELALQQYRSGLTINPRNKEFKREEAFHLNRLKRTDEAIVRLERLIQEDPNDTESISFLGRIYKQMWMETWAEIEDDQQRLQEAINAAHWLIKSINTYLDGYRLNQNNYYPGINALSLAVLLDYLATLFHVNNDPDVKAIRAELPKLKGAIHFVLENATRRNGSDYWALVSMAELEVSIARDPKQVTRAYRKALTAARKNMYSLKSSLSQLELFKSLNFRPEYVLAGIEVLQGELDRIKQEDETEEQSASMDPPQVFLFSGHSLDRSDEKPRFPAAMEKEVRDKLAKALDKFQANRNDLGITPGAACGGDIIFAELCLERGLDVEIHLPYEEARYIQRAISYAGDKWVERYYALRNHPGVVIRLQPDHLGPVKPGDNVYERNERWALYSSLIYGIDRTRLIALWDGMVDDIPGGPDNMLDQVRQFGGRVEHLNTTKFDYWKAGGKVSRALEILAMEV